MDPLKSLAIIFVLSFVVEALVEYLGQPVPARWKPYAGALVGVMLCLAYGADLLARLGYPARVPYVGEVLTGLLIGRGSNVLNDIIARITTPLSALRANWSTVLTGRTTSLAAPAVAVVVNQPAISEPTGTDPGAVATDEERPVV